MFLRAGEGVETGFSHSYCSGFFPCSRSEPIICYATWHAWGIKVFQMMEKNVDSQLQLLSNHGDDHGAVLVCLRT